MITDGYLENTIKTPDGGAYTTAQVSIGMSGNKVTYTVTLEDGKR